MSKTTKRLVMGAVCVLVGITVLLFVTARIFAGKFEPELRKRVVGYLEEKFDSKVSLADLQIEIPKVSPVGLLMRGGRGTVAHVEGRGLSLSHKENPDGAPLFTIDKFSFDLDLGMLRLDQPRIPHVALDGMLINLPPRTEKAGQKGQNNNANGMSSKVVIDVIDISHARLIIRPKRPEAQPLEFALGSIRLTSAGVGQQMEYAAALTNPRPPGQIHSKGKFGPWNSENPGDTPLEGYFDFANADLSVFPAIAGILHSSGHFSGTFSAVRAQGEATVPDFRLKESGNRVPLETRYDVLVDGLNGDTVLQPVHAKLGDTTFQTSGGIIQHKASGRRGIDLDVYMDNGHIEDLLRLAAKGKPFMSGLIKMNAKISIPPLSESVKEKLFLDGSFNIARGEFLRDAVQDKVDELSRRGQGKPTDHTVDNVFSQMSGTFRLENQVMTFRRLSFAVPGAAVGLHGDYHMAEDTLDFHGNLRLNATISETLAGWKHWLAKPLDRFFEKNGAGTFIRIQVVGSTSKPEFGRDKEPQQQ